MAVTLNAKYLEPFVHEGELQAILPQVEAAHRTIHEKSGPGNDFLGWLDLPVNYDREEFDRILKAAQKIRSHSQVLVVCLTYIYGIGRKSAKDILEKAGVNPDTRVKDLTDAEEQKLRDVIDNYIVEGDLRRQTALDIKRLSEIGCYRGMRHRKGLPVRGQRSKTNARTRKGPKKTIANKKK